MFKSKSLLVGAAIIAALSLTACTSSKSADKPAAAEQKGVSVKDGAAKMLHELTELKGDLEKNDAVKAKEHANEVHEAWETFEDLVKDQDKALYEKIEAPLGAIVAGTKEGKDLDVKVLKDQAAQLEGLLTPLTK